MGENSPIRYATIRKRLFVDPDLQGKILFRAVAYWAFVVIDVGLMLFCLKMVLASSLGEKNGLDEMWRQYGPALLVFGLLLPVMLVDLLRLTNRIAGPMNRLRRAMQALAKGEEVDQLTFRRGDFWSDFARDFNELTVRVRRLERIKAEALSRRADERVPEAENRPEAQESALLAKISQSLHG